MPVQLTLNVTLKERCSFESFLPGDNAEAVAQLERALHDRSPALFLHGLSGVGKTHLLQAACRALDARAAYVPLRAARDLSPAFLDGLENAALICVDDVHAVAADRAWLAGLVALFDAARARGALWVATGADAPQWLGLALPDLETRLRSGLVYALKPLDDAQKLAALRHAAQARGLDLSEEVGRYVLARYPRDLHALFDLLDRLDHAALVQQRRLTIPFVRDLEGVR